MPSADVPILQDQGILISDDIVSIEQCTVNILLQASPLPQSSCDGLKAVDSDIFYNMYRKPYIKQIESAEILGLGSRSYELEEI